MPSESEIVGLTSSEAERRLAAERPNTLPGAAQRGTFAVAPEVLRQPMFLLLAAGTLIYLLLGDAREALVLAASIVVVITITVVRERKSWAHSRRCAIFPGRAQVVLTIFPALGAWRVARHGC